MLHMPVRSCAKGQHMNRFGYLLSAVLAMQAGFATAGPLATDPNAFIRIDLIHEPFHGTSHFELATGPGPLEGYIDWAVYGPGVLPASYVGMPVDPGDWLYAFQFHNTGTTPVAQIALLTVTYAAGNTASVNDVGTFTSEGIDGNSPTEFGAGGPGFGGDYPYWSFSDPILPGGASIGLAYSSDHLPTFFDDYPSNGYINDNVEEFNNGYFFVSKPHAHHIPLPETPEPSSLILGLFALVGLAVVAVRKRRAQRA